MFIKFKRLYYVYGKKKPISGSINHNFHPKKTLNCSKMFEHEIGGKCFKFLLTHKLAILFINKNISVGLMIMPRLPM